MRSLFIVLVACASTRAQAQTDRITRSADSDCAALTSLALGGVQITTAAAVQPTDAQRAAGRAPVCRVAGLIGTETHFVALLPDNWNRRFMMGGGGGFVGAVDNNAQASVNAGYATAGNDAGHQGNAITAGWA
jgi:feruloyl esterase